MLLDPRSVTSTMCWPLALAVLATWSTATPTAAVDLNLSRLTTVDLAKCRVLQRHRHGNAWRCPGLPGYPVYVAEGDLRFMLAFGPEPQRRTSARQTLGPFNTVFKDKQRTTVEWRVERVGTSQIVPYATIVRFATSRDGVDGEVLVVTKVSAKDSCQLAVLDAAANPDAMAMVRAWAIAEARKRPCPSQPEVIGNKGNALD
jgi:hypothetical protein